MARPFIKMNRDEFALAVAGHNWKTPKSEIHVHGTWRPNHAQYQGLHSIEAMYRFHTETRKWSDIAQHISIAPDGAIWSGRPWDVTPASAAGNNGPHVFMFEMIGDFDSGNDPLAGEQLESALFVVATLQIWFGMPLWSSVRFHNQMTNKKTCPGSSVDRSLFIVGVSNAREALEKDQARLFGSGVAKPELLAATADNSIHPEGRFVEDGEHEHGPALESFMTKFHSNPFEEPSGPKFEVKSVGGGKDAAILAAVSALADKQHDIEALFFELGRRTRLIEANPSVAGEFDVAASPLPEGFGEGFTDLGKRILSRVEKGMHNLLCGTSGEDASDRAKLRNALGVSESAATGVLVTILTSSFAMAPALAVVVAALLVKIVLRPTYEETCTFWGERLD